MSPGVRKCVAQIVSLTLILIVLLQYVSQQTQSIKSSIISALKIEAQKINAILDKLQEGGKTQIQQVAVKLEAEISKSIILSTFKDTINLPSLKSKSNEVLIQVISDIKTQLKTINIENIASSISAKSGTIMMVGVLLLYAFAIIPISIDLYYTATQKM